jgi:ketosteroid isomerase-like protein
MDETPREAVRAAVDRETVAWDEQDVEALLDLFHPDMVWAWPPTAYDHDPVEWDLELGRFDRERWRAAWQELFDTHDLVHNRRETRRIAVTEQDDGAMAVVDIDTLWRHRETGEPFHWEGRTAKLYARLDEGWTLTAHWGALAFEDGLPVVDASGGGPAPN